MRPTIFGREPAVVVALIQGALAMLVAFGWLAGVGIKGQAELALVMAVVIAGMDLYVAYATRATLLAVIVGFVKALIAFGTIYGFELSVEETGSLIAFLTVAVGFFQRTQTEPLERGDFELRA